MTSIPGRRPQRVRHELRFRMLTVQQVETLSPHMVRVTLGGDELAGFHSPGFDDLSVVRTFGTTWGVD